METSEKKNRRNEQERKWVVLERFARRAKWKRQIDTNCAVSRALEMFISTVMVWQERPFLKQTGEEKDVVEKRREDQNMQVHGCPWKQWETFSPEIVSTESPVENCRFRNLGCIYSHFCCLPAMDGLGFEAFSRTLSRENHETVSIAICLT